MSDPLHPSVRGGRPRSFWAGSLASDLQIGHNSDQMSETLPFSEVKAHLSEIADRVEQQHDRVLVTRNGRPVFVMMSPDDLESLEETISIVRDPELMESIRRSRREAAKGKRLKLRDQL